MKESIITEITGVPVLLRVFKRGTITSASNILLHVLPRIVSITSVRGQAARYSLKIVCIQQTCVCCVCFVCVCVCIVRVSIALLEQVIHSKK